VRRGRRGELVSKSETIVLLPIDVQIGDRFSDEESEWAGQPFSKASRREGPACADSADEQGAAERDVTWPAHVRESRFGGVPSQ
jgi:hypothetical protein